MWRVDGACEMGDRPVKAVYEDMVAMLLSTLHPDAERLAGRGGGAVRDVQVREDIVRCL
jgi:hypothetical protein